MIAGVMKFGSFKTLSLFSQIDSCVEDVIAAVVVHTDIAVILADHALNAS